MMLLLMSVLLNGCATEPIAVCQVFEPIYVSHLDVLTKETKQQIVQYNELAATLSGLNAGNMFTNKPHIKELNYGRL